MFSKADLYRHAYTYQKEFYDKTYIIICFVNVLNCKLELHFTNMDDYNGFRKGLGVYNELEFSDIIDIYNIHRGNS
jgi:hypothetical protein